MFKILKKPSFASFASALVIVLATFSLNYANARAHNINDICNLSPAECLDQVDETIAATVEKSRRWYQLQQFKLEALFNLQRTKALFELTKFWLTQPDLPVPFQFTVYLYYAKTSIYYGKEQEGRKYIHKAQEQLDLMHSVYPAPIRLVELANIQLYIGETEQAEASLTALLQKYKNSGNAHLLMEICGNLAHLSVSNGQQEQAQAYWNETLVWAKEYGNVQQIATVYFNLGFLLRTMGKLPRAEHNLMQAIQYSKVAKDFVKITNANVLIADIKYQQGHFSEAVTFIEAIDPDILSHEHLEIYNKVKRGSAEK